MLQTQAQPLEIVLRPARPPRSAGDPKTWALIVAGTCLEDVPWPGYGTCGWDAPHLRGGDL